MRAKGTAWWSLIVAATVAALLLAAAPASAGCAGDRDHDGVANCHEKRIRTNPRRADTDRDGLTDGLELRLGTNPRAADTDGDGHDDGREALDDDDPRKAYDHGAVEVELEVPLDSATPAFVILGGRLTIDASGAELEGAVDLDDLQSKVDAARAAGKVLQVEIEIHPESLAGGGALVASKVEVEEVCSGDGHDDDDYDDGDHDDDHDDDDGDDDD